MKKPYILFGAILVVLLLALSFTQSYLTKLEDDTKKVTTQGATKGDLEELKKEVGEQLSEQQERMLARLDSLEQRIRTNIAADTVRVEPLPEPAKPAARPKDTAKVTTESAPAETTVEKVAVARTPPSELENVIYVRYAKARWALAPNLTNYELKLAKNQIMTEIGKDYDMTAEEILQIIDKVYEYRKANRKP